MRLTAGLGSAACGRLTGHAGGLAAPRAAGAVAGLRGAARVVAAPASKSKSSRRTRGVAVKAVADTPPAAKSEVDVGFDNSSDKEYTVCGACVCETAATRRWRLCVSMSSLSLVLLCGDQTERGAI
jgi:hypothetical protein